MHGAGTYDTIVFSLARFGINDTGGEARRKE